MERERDTWRETHTHTHTSFQLLLASSAAEWAGSLLQFSRLPLPPLHASPSPNPHLQLHLEPAEL